MYRNDLSDYIRANFEAQDRLAIVLINKKAGSVLQQLTTAEQMTTEPLQQSLREHNALHYNVYLSMNALSADATSRRKQDVKMVRHIYLDFDDNAETALNTLLARRDIPAPNYTVQTSPSKWHAIWRVQEFDKEYAEQLQRGLARQTGADVAATDCSRVLRLPYFYNHKYGAPYWVTVTAHFTHEPRVYRPEDFPQALTERSRDTGAQRSSTRPSSLRISQSERDWAYAKRALARGDSPELVIAAIASHRRYEKHDPQYYARLTVAKAAEALRQERAQAYPGTLERRDAEDRSLPSR